MKTMRRVRWDERGRWRVREVEVGVEVAIADADADAAHDLCFVSMRFRPSDRADHGGTAE